MSNETWNACELDRLVDGELQGEAYRDLLRRLDRSDEGWKQCALAFLEAQALRKELAGLGERPAAKAAPANDDPLRTEPAGLPSWVWPLAMAACVCGLLFWQAMTPAPPVPDAPDRPGIAQTSEPEPVKPEGMLEVTWPEGAGANPRRNVSVPIYAPEDYARLPSDLSQRNREMDAIISRKGRPLDHQIVIQYVAMPDGRVAMVPVDVLVFPGSPAQ